ncbi:hypothetical protein CQA48_30595, partial [Klebsiella pneumoniae]
SRCGVPAQQMPSQKLFLTMGQQTGLAVALRRQDSSSSSRCGVPAQQMPSQKLFLTMGQQTGLAVALRRQ